jgi:RNase P subunit RPR2
MVIIKSHTMIEKRCKKCNRLLFMEQNGTKQIKANNIEYNFNGCITVVCKCGIINKFWNETKKSKQLEYRKVFQYWN